MKYQMVIERSRAVATFIEDNKNALIDVLTDFESRLVAEDEIARTVDLLNSMNENSQYFTDNVINKVATFLPLNLPLYSLFLFALVPSHQSKSVSVRAPQLLQKALEKITEALNVKLFYPNVNITNIDRTEFVENECKTSDVVIFTGKYSNFLAIKDKCPKNTLFLYNGVGHNPVVIAADANIPLAAEKVAFLKTFNNGQDCAGADMILVHKDVISTFIRELEKSLANVTINSSYKTGAEIGPLVELSSILSTADMLNSFHSERGEIIYGGSIDFKTGIVQPTICRCHIRNFCNYKELYSPIIIVAEYDSDNELATYFNDIKNQYIQEQMYVSVFGTSEYIANNVLGTIILKDVTVHDVERGTEEYGGYSHGASLISKSSITISKPILIPREIHNYALSTTANLFNVHIEKTSPKESLRSFVANQFTQNVKAIFGSNLEFGFIFGSFVTGRGKAYSDIDTFICIKEIDEGQISQYINWVFDMCELTGRIPDFVYPAEIMTYKQLKKALELITHLELSNKTNSSSAYDSMVWSHALSNSKLGIINPENIPENWLSLFQVQCERLFRSYLNNRYLQDTKNDNSEMIIKNILAEKNLLNVFKEIPFDTEYQHLNIIRSAINRRNFFGRKYILENKKIFPTKTFRFGPA